MKQYKITLAKSNIAFYYDNSISLLKAIEENNINPEYGCRQGFCGTCCCEIISGSFFYPCEPLAFIPNGSILLCYACITSDLVLNI